MATVREAFSEFLDRLSDGEVEALFEQVKAQFDDDLPILPLEDWLEEIAEIRDILTAKYGEFPNAADMVNEVREERLNDLIGGQ